MQRALDPAAGGAALNHPLALSFMHLVARMQSFRLRA
jgi:hypothetical protein